MNVCPRCRPCRVLWCGWIVGAIVMASAPGGASLMASDERPHVVLIMVDTLRSDHLGCYGYGRDTTPYIDRVAASGTLFETCYSPASWTFPAVMSLMTGWWPAAHGCVQGYEALDDAVPTLAESLQQRGYWCGAVVSNPQLNRAFGFGRGFDRYDDQTVLLDAELGLFDARPGRAAPRSVPEMVTSHTVTDLGLAQVDLALASQQPFFLFLVYFDPHDHYLPPRPWDRAFDPEYAGPQDGRGIKDMRHQPPRGPDLAHLEARYDGEIRYTDGQIERFVTTLEQRVDTDDLLLIIVSDHGEAFGEHGKLHHGNNPHVEEARVPMIWRWPGKIAAGHRVRTAVSLVDVPVSLQALLNVPRPATAHGRTLVSALAGGAVEASPVLSERARGVGHHVAWTDVGYRLHARFDVSPEEEDAAFVLYDMARDPRERRALEDHPRMDGMRRDLVRLWRRCEALRPAAGTHRKPDLDPLELQRLLSLGYTEGTPDADGDDDASPDP